MYIFASLLIAILVLYGVLWLLSIKKYPVDFGISFNQNHAVSLGLDWKQTYLAMLDDLKPTYIRIAAMWSEIEKQKGVYDFSDIDFMMHEAQTHGTKVTLVVGQKAPRWPECHVPAWSADLSESEYRQSLINYIGAVINRYKKHTALELWQVENEPFIRFRFGDCKNFKLELVDDEIKLVHILDDVHLVMVTDSGELSTWSTASKAGDIFGTTMYRVVRTPRGIVWKYDWLPAAFYRLKAKLVGIPLERLYIAELQAEPWFTNTAPTDTPLEEQTKTMNPTRLVKHIEYAKRVGTRRAYLWGLEWWYWMKKIQQDDTMWKLIKEEVSSSTEFN
ncbi:MAG: endo-1,4-beta-xylanase [Candidatus Magasanikbacteria bacterium]|nr:endo-1,4-beta-xylanase [Candidatus Magasanikbacteria bacterium]